MKVLWFLVLATLLALVMLCLIPPAQAGSCGIGYSAYSTYSYPTYASYSSYTPIKAVKVVKEVAVPTYLPIAVYPIIVPSYAASYGSTASYGSVAPPARSAPAQTQPSPCEETKALTQAMLKVLERLESLEKRSHPTPPPAVPKGRGDPFNPGTSAPLSQLETARSCSACHDRNVAEEKGAGFVLTDGGRIVATPEQRLASLRMVLQGKMPKVGGKATPLPNDRGAAVVAELSAQ